MSQPSKGPGLRDMAMIILAIFAIGFLALAVFGCQASQILSNVSGPI